MASPKVTSLFGVLTSLALFVLAAAVVWLVLVRPHTLFNSGSGARTQQSQQQPEFTKAANDVPTTNSQSTTANSADNIADIDQELTDLNQQTEDSLDLDKLDETLKQL